MRRTWRIGQLRQPLIDRIVESELTLLHEDHRPDRRHRLGQRRAGRSCHAASVRRLPKAIVPIASTCSRPRCETSATRPGSMPLEGAVREDGKGGRRRPWFDMRQSREEWPPTTPGTAGACPGAVGYSEGVAGGVPEDPA